MTDKPNPVELKKEISGHPTDHTRKAGLSPEEVRMRDACFHDMKQVIYRAMMDTKPGDIDGREALRFLLDSVSQTVEGFGYVPDEPQLVIADREAGASTLGER